jgi:hypothetical protein
MRISAIVGICSLIGILPIPILTQSTDINLPPWNPEIRLVGSITLPGSFVSPQTIYADNERIFAGSYQGDLFILERDRQANFPVIQVVHFPSSITGVQGDEDILYVASRDGRLYSLAKSWPLQITGSILLSDYGLSALHVAGSKVYVSKGQSVMAASPDRLYLSGLNWGDSGIEIPNGRSFGDLFEPNTTTVYDRNSFDVIGKIRNPGWGVVNVTASRDLLYFTTFGWGIYIYDAATLQRRQILGRSANTVAVAKRRGTSLLVGGSESGLVDLYALGENGYQFINSANLPAVTGFMEPEDIEIRALWFDGIDNLVFAGSSWGRWRSRSSDLPSFFVLEVDRKVESTQQ